MNEHLERVCRAFGSGSCESASGAEIFLMLVSAALAVIVVCWLIARLRSNLGG